MIGGGHSKERFGVSLLFPEAFFFMFMPFTGLYKQSFGEGGGCLRMFNSERTWANVRGL
jgi:hypothetical protein